ncbi:MAG TPA: Lrp/AsnC family transcriptional regulator [Marinobacterium sp.]|nr:Lrp/AsnC family transcriptional regulator [Marinobacterium sp.]
MKKIPLDALDIRILSAIQQHGQLSKGRLAEIVNLSPTPCWLRVTKLKNAGLILGYRGLIRLDKLIDLTRVYMTVSLDSHKKADFERFERRIMSVDEIVECSSTGGGCDYVMKLITPSLSYFQQLVEQLLDEDIGIDRYYIYVVTREIKSTTLSLAQLMELKRREES